MLALDLDMAAFEDEPPRKLPSRGINSRPWERGSESDSETESVSESEPVPQRWHEMR